MKLQLFCLVSIFSCASLLAMHKEQTLPQNESRKLTIIDLDQIEKANYLAMSNDEKWKLHEDSRELARRYMFALAKQNETIETVKKYLEQQESLLRAKQSN